MGTHLNAKDLPQPWFHKKSSSISQGKQRSVSPKSNTKEDSVRNEVEDVPRKRGRPRKLKETMETHLPKGKKKGKSLAASAENMLVGCANTPSADVEELRRKREEDARACGRTLRTVNNPGKRKSQAPIEEANSRHGEGRSRGGSPTASPGIMASTKGSPIPKSREGGNTAEKDSTISMQACNDNTEAALHERTVEDEVLVPVDEDLPDPPFIRRLGKEHVVDDVGKGVDFIRRMEDHVNSKHVDTDEGSDSEKQDSSSGGRQELHMHSTPSTKKRSEERYEQRYEHRYRSSNRESRGQQTRSFRSMSRSPPRFYWRSDMEDRQNPPHSPSNSPKLRGDGRSCGNGYKHADDYEVDYYEDRLPREYRDDRRISNRDDYHRRQQSSREAKGPRHRQFDSEDSGRGRSGWRCTPERSKSSRDKENRSSLKTDSRSRSPRRKEEENMRSSPASERKERRRQQSIRESDKSRRLKDGKKPFYLVVNDEGKPYGPGKPAWITEINRLAVGLDPSCTHIRKQTFEAIRTFKDRLNEKFDYSEALNEDHLRGLMGKAVTKRRGELITLIRRGGSQPKNIDRPIWKRLKKLADSKQREDKSNQGRYANSCRKTLGRTGSIGSNGVREKLRAVYGRSPDPDEVQEEMERDKGYGGQKRKGPAFSVKMERKSVEVISSEGELMSDGSGDFVEHSSAETDHLQSSKRPVEDVTKSIGRGVQYGLQAVEVSREERGRRQETHTLTEAKDMSTDDYIEKLEAQIKRLEAVKAKAKAWNGLMPCQ